MKSEKIEKIVDLAATLASKADEIDHVIVIYRMKEDVNGTQIIGSFDNDIEVRDALWLTQNFQFWMMAACSGLLESNEDS